MSQRHQTWHAEAVIVGLEAVLVGFAPAHRADWSWWANRNDLPGDQMVEAGWGRDPRDVIREFTPQGDPDAELQMITTRERTLLRTVRRPRGVGSLTRSLPPGRWG